MRTFRLHRVLLGLLAITVLSIDAAAQAWVQPPGNAYIKLAHGRSDAAEQFSADGTRIPYNLLFEDEDTFSDRSYYLYGEVGVTPRLTLVGLLPLKEITLVDELVGQETGPIQASGVGSLMFGVRWDLQPSLGFTAEDRHAAAANVMLTVPTGYTRNASPSIGAGQVDLQGMLHYGLSLFPFPGYAQVGIGLRLRSDIYELSKTIDCSEVVRCQETTRPDYGNEWLMNGEVGVNLGRWVLAQALVQSTWSNQAPESTFDPANPFPTLQRFVKTGIGVTVSPVPLIGLSVQYFTTPVGRNTIVSDDVFWGVEVRM